MKIVSQNHAACLAHASELDSTERLMLDAIACDLRSLFEDGAGDLPDDLLSLAFRLETPPPDRRVA